MKSQEVLDQLKALSNEKVFAHNSKNGAKPGSQFGVKLGDIRMLANRIKTNHQLGLDLWSTRNIDARLLAILVLEPNALSIEQLDGMIKSIDFVQVADWFNAYILKEHPDKGSLRERWMISDNVWAARAGWSLTAGEIARGSNIDIGALLDKLEKEMPMAPPEVQWTMNTALAYAGIHHEPHRARAIAIGNKLGIYRDYPVSKGCTSPFAPVWIGEMVRRQSMGKKSMR